MELSKNYQFSEVEEKIFKLWEKDAHMSASCDDDGESFTIVIPPPNVTGVLHMGHALNNTFQDILIRLARLKGKKARWVVGTDHAGIATQNVVDKKLVKEGKSRDSLGREKFLKEVWDWKEKHGGVIIKQLKKLGCSADYARERFTMDEGLAYSVRYCFVELYKRDLIYQGNRIIHWCSKDLTALSDEEAEHHDHNGKLYTLKYRFEDDSGFIEIATTRPETLLGDTAVAVNPDDERYKNIIGKNVIVPFVDRPIKIIADSFVEPDFGTGLVKVTPAHDPNDYDMGMRHHLELISVMANDGKMNENAGPYQGMDRFDCRKKIIHDLKERGELVDVKDHEMAIRRCYRCDTIVEPKVSKQWFVKMQPMANVALEHFNEGKPTFSPPRYGNIYKRWLEGIRDWCISRQIWWGHQIPVWYCADCQHMTVSLKDPTSCEKCESSNIEQDKDVLDTWFSSWLWPMSTLGWPEKTPDLKEFFPTHTLATAQEIIFFWVARMVMSSLEFCKEVPFEKVYIHGTVRDEKGIKMSKSLGNVIDPLEIIEEFGADALRFSLMMIASTGNDIYLSNKKFEIGRNFATKIWNAFKFFNVHLQKGSVGRNKYLEYRDNWTNDDKLILFKCDELGKLVQENIEQYRFNDAALALYDFFWTYFCDRYLERVKPDFWNEGAQKDKTISILYYCFTQFLICLHPIMPFQTEELWQILKEIDGGLTNLVATTSFPKKSETKIEWGDDLYFTEKKYELITEIRNLRNSFNISPKGEIEIVLQSDGNKKLFLDIELESLKKMVRAKDILVKEHFEPSAPMPSKVCELGVVFLKLDENLVDKKAESKKLQLELDKLLKGIVGIEKKLQNEKFVQNAPKEVIDREKERLGKLKEEEKKVLELVQFFQ